MGNWSSFFEVVLPDWQQVLSYVPILTTDPCRHNVSPIGWLSLTGFIDWLLVAVILTGFQWLLSKWIVLTGPRLAAPLRLFQWLGLVTLASDLHTRSWQLIPKAGCWSWKVTVLTETTSSLYRRVVPQGEYPKWMLPPTYIHPRPSVTQTALSQPKTHPCTLSSYC